MIFLQQSRQNACVKQTSMIRKIGIYSKHAGGFTRNWEQDGGQDEGQGKELDDELDGSVDRSRIIN